MRERAASFRGQALDALAMGARPHLKASCPSPSALCTSYVFVSHAITLDSFFGAWACDAYRAAMEAHLKMKAQIIEAEGDAVELARFYKDISGGTSDTAPPVNEVAEGGNGNQSIPETPAIPEASETTQAYLSVAVARRVLSRRILSPQMRATLKRLYDAHPTMVSAHELQKLTNYQPAQLAGLLGAFGRRVGNTPGYKRNTSFFTYEYDYTLNAWRYGLPDGPREAVRLEGIA